MMKMTIFSGLLLVIGLSAVAQESPFGKSLAYSIENAAVFEENQEEGRVI